MITIHMLPSISRNKGRETMRFGQLKKYRMKNIFLKDHTQNLMEKSKLSILWTNSLTFFPVCFYCISKMSTTKIY